MIHHLSIAAREPERVAGVLAELMGGVAVPDAGNSFIWQLDEHGSGVEVYPAGMELQPGGATGGTFVKRETGRGFGPTHVALSVATAAATWGRSLPRRPGWDCKPASPCSRYTRTHLDKVLRPTPISRATCWVGKLSSRQS